MLMQLGFPEQVPWPWAPSERHDNITSIKNNRQRRISSCEVHNLAERSSWSKSTWGVGPIDEQKNGKPLRLKIVRIFGFFGGTIMDNMAWITPDGWLSHAASSFVSKVDNLYCLDSSLSTICSSLASFSSWALITASCSARVLVSEAIFFSCAILCSTCSSRFLSWPTSTSCTW